MAELIAIGDPVNDGERRALSCLRDELPADWSLVANFTFVQGRRPFECDVLAVGPAGWGYLVEVKAWTGHIRGNDAQWELPPLAGDQPSYRPNPFSLVEQKAKALASLLREAEQPLKTVWVAPIVVLVSEDQPELDGRCAEGTVLLRDAPQRILADPRPFEKKPPADSVARVVAALTTTGRPIAPAHVAGSWELIELVESGPSWEIWSARSRLGGENSRVVRMKRYLLDPLLTGTDRARQHDRARRDLEALERLAGTDGAVPPVSAAEEDGEYLMVVTDWPDGESLSSLLASKGLTAEAAEEIFEALVIAVASVHRVGIVHRHLSLQCAHYLPEGRVVLTDFDYARIPAAATITQYIADELVGPFTAPEVNLDPAATSKASDIWSVARIGAALFGGDSEEGAPPGLRKILGRALSADPADRPQDAEILLAELHGDGGDLLDRLEPDDELEDRWVVRRHPVAEGGIARVYKVFDTLVERYYAAKFVKPEYRHLIDPAEEYQLLCEVPDHPGLVKPEIPQAVTRLRREKRQREYHDVFVPTRWIEGPRLDQLLAERLPTERCIELILAISEAVAHLHDHSLLHRDLKPQNVIVEQPSGAPLVVDFNVSRHEDMAGQTKTGTEPYRPPDLGETGWCKGADVFALGVILCELVAGELLQRNCRAWIAEAPINDRLRAFLDRATSAHANDRFTDVPDFAGALRALSRELSDARKHVDAAAFPAADEDEISRANWNPYQTRLVGLFSQSSSSNAGTRGLDEFGRWAYVETLIDRALFQDIVDGQHSLVVITGNAGDGKTAFIQVLEQRLADQGARVVPRPEGNGASIEWRGRSFVTNWDGSQDEGTSGNDEVLGEFFSPFAGNDPEPGPGETRIIAINEGRMIDFLVAQRETFPWLSTVMLDLFNSEVPPQADWLAVVNLNLRALTILQDDGSSIVGKLLEKFSDERLWEPCDGCLAAEHCYARANAEVLRDPVLGARVSERLRETLEVARLRRRLHITMRDLRSALAFAVSGNRTCDEILHLVEENDGKALLAGHVYNSIFAGNPHSPSPASSAAARRDRLLAVTGTLDVALTANPGDDARLWTLGPKAIRGDPAGVARTDRHLLDELRERLPNGAAQLLDHQARADLRLLHASLRRKRYFETEDPGWIDMLPYDRLGRFVRQLGGIEDEDRESIVRAISQSEGMFNESFNDRLAVRLASDGLSPARSFVTHASSEFELEPADRSAAAKYVEYAPDTLRLSHRLYPDLSLEVDLDLYEMLSRVLDGFTPSREEQRGAWLNLRIFKERLATYGADALLLTRDDETYFSISKDHDGAVCIERAS